MLKGNTVVPPPPLPPKKMAHVTASAWDTGNGFDSLLHTQIPGDTRNVFQYSCPRERGAFPSDGARGAVPRDGRRSGATSVACFDWRNTGRPCTVISGLPKQGFVCRSAQTLPENQGITFQEHKQWGPLSTAVPAQTPAWKGAQHHLHPRIPAVWGANKRQHSSCSFRHEHTATVFSRSVCSHQQQAIPINLQGCKALHPGRAAVFITFCVYKQESQKRVCESAKLAFAS